MKSRLTFSDSLPPPLPPHPLIPTVTQSSLAAAEAEALAKERSSKAAADHAPAAAGAGTPAATNAAGVSAAEESIAAALAAVGEVDDAALTSFLSSLSKLLGGANAHIAERMGNPANGEEGAPPAKVKYIASTQDFVKQAGFSETDGGVTFRSWIMPEAPPPPEETGVEGAEAPPPPPPPELPVIHIANALRDPSVVFHGVPKPGSYIAAPLQYGCVVHDGACPPDAAPVTAEDGTVSAPAPVAVQRSLAVCVDTVGSGAGTFTDAHVATVKRCAGYLKAALERTEAAIFADEYKANLAPKAEADAAAVAEAAAAAEAATKGELRLGFGGVYGLELKRAFTSLSPLSNLVRCSHPVHPRFFFFLPVPLFCRSC